MFATDFERYSHEIELANGLFLENSYELSHSYLNEAQDWYRGEVSKLDFVGKSVEATNHINSWVNNNTHGKIPEMFSTAVGSNTVLVIASALYFKALWENMFIEGATRPREFFPNGRNGSPVMVDMMAHGGCFPYYESHEFGVRILGIPYKNGQSTMYVIKPNNSSRQVLLEFISKLNSGTVNSLIDNMKQMTAVVLFPKLHVSSTMNLKKVLRNLKVQSLFKPAKSDLSGISGRQMQPDVSERPAGAFQPAVNLPPAASRPAAVNLPDIPKKHSGNHKLDFNDRDKLVFSRFENESSTAVDDTTEPTTFETEIDSTILPATTLASPTSPKAARSFRRSRDVSYKAPSEHKGKPDPLNGKDFFLNKRIVKTTPGKKSHRTRRDAATTRDNLYVSDAIHKVDLDINERGTEGGAATAITLNRSGTNVVFRADEPFLLVIRNDKTKLPLFFGAVYDPRP